MKAPVGKNNETTHTGAAPDPAGYEPFFQPKLTVNTPGDAYEQEADRVADQVMRMRDGDAPVVQRMALTPFSIRGDTGHFAAQRQCADCEREEKDQIQRKETGQTNIEETAPTLVSQVLQSGSGRPMDGNIRQLMENRFGQDFSQVRIHTDDKAADSATAIQARAYTSGNNIVFGSGHYRPHVSDGQRLLSHELVHVVQQKQANRPGQIQRFEAGMHESAERYGLSRGGRFNQEEISAVYFGNWMRDFNQAFTPMLVNVLGADTLFALVSYLALKKFGREMTPEQFGYYIPAEHMDNPAGMMAGSDFLTTPPAPTAAVTPAHPTRLGSPRPTASVTPQEDVNPGTAQVLGAGLFSVDQTGVMAHIRRSNLHVERRLELAAQQGRTPEGMMHFGAALHAVEDLFAHSNFVEIAVGKLLQDDPTFLPALSGSSRQVFAFSPTVSLPGGRGNRPALTTGTFTTSDTMISLSSELVGFLSRPLSPAPTPAEQAAQERFVLALIRSAQTRMRNSAPLQAQITQVLNQAGIPGWMHGTIMNMPYDQIYLLVTSLQIPVPESLREPIRNAQQAIRNYIHTWLSDNILRPLARQIQASAMEASVADTSLIPTLREHQRVAGGGALGTVDQLTVETQHTITGRSEADLIRERRQDARARATALEATPEPVVAGPSHSQLAKDHPNSPFFGLAFRLAATAVERLSQKMTEAWTAIHGASSGQGHFDFSWGNFPQSPPAGSSESQTQTYDAARHLYHDQRVQRGQQAQSAYQRGTNVINQGGIHTQPYSPAAMRTDSAARIRAVASALRAIAATPTQASQAVATLQPYLPSDRQAVLERARQQLRGVQQSATIRSLTDIANDLDQIATQTQNATTHALRQSANQALVLRRDEAIHALSQSGIPPQSAATILIVLNEEVQVTAVSYTAEQRGVLAGTQHLNIAGQAQQLQVETITLPALSATSARPAATVALLQESRLLISHPYEQTWWQAVVRDYAADHAQQLQNDIEARNIGIAFYRETGGNITDEHQ